jgi:hypothetical protein
MALSMKSILKPSESVMAGLATAGFVYGVYQLNLPSMTEVHGANPHNQSVASSQKKAMWGSAAAVAGMFLLTKDATVFTAGALMFLYEEWGYRHANAVHPGTGKVQPMASQRNAMDMGSGSEDSTDDGGYGGSYGFM